MIIGAVTLGLLTGYDESGPDAHDSQAIAGAIFDQNGAVWGDLECLAFAIRDPATHIPVGALTAAHCSYVNPDLINQALYVREPAWHTVDNVTSVTVPARAQNIEIGSNSSALKILGRVHKVLVASDNSSDEAVEAFDGYTLSETLKDLSQELASDAEVHAMIPGKTRIYVAGWPARQTGDGHGHQEQQRFAALFIGRSTAETITGKTIDVILAAFPETQDGATCSAGMSGSGAFILNGSRPALLGTTFEEKLVIHPDTLATAAELNSSVDWSQYASVCAIARPTLGSQPDTLLDVD